MIPAAAVEAAARAYRREFPYDENEDYVVKLTLEAAAPHMNPARSDDLETDLHLLIKDIYSVHDPRLHVTTPADRAQIVAAIIAAGWSK